MSRTALLALCMAILIPAASYLWLKSKSENAVNMPRHYLLDTVVEREVNGRRTQDSIWHQTGDIQLVNQLGDTVSLYQLAGKIVVADFFFTHCGTICPGLTRTMADLQQSFLRGGNIRKKPDSSIVHFLSFSIDPERDSVKALRKYADRFGAIHDNWWFLTGPRDSIYKFVFEELKVDKFDSHPLDSSFIHTNRFVLLDKRLQVRGYYNATLPGTNQRIAEDIGLLMLEKETGGRRKLPFDPAVMGVFFLIAALVTAVAIYFLSRRRRQEKY